MAQPLGGNSLSTCWSSATAGMGASDYADPVLGDPSVDLGSTDHRGLARTLTRESGENPTRSQRSPKMMQALVGIIRTGSDSNRLETSASCKSGRAHKLKGGALQPAGT